MRIEEQTVKSLTIAELRAQWSKAWGFAPHWRIGRKMLEHSLIFKLREAKGYGLTDEQMQRLNQLVTAVKRNPHYFDQGHSTLKPGTKLLRCWKGTIHTVIVTAEGFDYQGKVYTSLSKIACDITGSHWNGWLFFGLRKKKAAT